jgi:AAA domain
MRGVIGTSSEMLVVILTRTVSLVSTEPFMLCDGGTGETDIDLVILDPFVKTHGIEENQNSAMDDVIQILADLASEEDIAVDIPHHTSKGRAAAPGDADRGRGASSVKDGARLVYTLTTMTTEEAKAFGVEEGERRLFFRVDSGKVNIAPPSKDAVWFHLVGVSLGNSSERYPHGDNVQTVVRWNPPKTFEGITADLTNRILAEIKDGLGDGNYFTDASNATERAAWGVVQKHASQKTETQCRNIIKEWLKREVLMTFTYHHPITRKDVKGLKPKEM